MNQSLVAVRYANALFMLVKEKNEVKKVYNDMQTLDGYCTEMNDFVTVLNSPVIKPSQKKAFLESAFTNSLSPLTLGFLNLLIDKNREAVLKMVIKDFIGLVKRDENIRSVVLYSAFPLDDSQVKAMTDLLTKEFNCTIELKIKVKPDIIGGFIIKVEDKLLDASIAKRLETIQKQLLQ